MVKTGVHIFIALSLVVMLLPLLPLCLLLIRRAAKSAVLNVLKLLCAYFFLHELLIALASPNSPSIKALLQLPEFALSIILLKLMTSHKKASEWLNLFLVSFMSVVVTIYAVKGMPAYQKVIIIAQALTGAALAIVVLVQLINNKQMALLSEPMFWIAGGSFCYFGMLGFMEAITPAAGALPQEEMLISFITNVTRFAFFSIAAYVAPATVSSRAHRLR